MLAPPAGLPGRTRTRAESVGKHVLPGVPHIVFDACRKSGILPGNAACPSSGTFVLDDEEACSTFVGLWLAWTIHPTYRARNVASPMSEAQTNRNPYGNSSCLWLAVYGEFAAQRAVAKQVWLQYPLPPNLKGRGTASLVNHHAALAVLSVSDKIRLYCTPLLQPFLAAPTYSPEQILLL